MEGTSPQRAREQLELLARGLERRPSHNNRPGSAARGAWTTSNSAAPVREAIPELDSMPGSSEARLRSKLAVLAGPDVPRRRATLEGGARPASAASLHRRVSAPPLAAAPALPPAAVAAPAPQLVMRAAPPLLAEGAGGDAETRLSPLPERAALRVSDDLRQQGRAPVPEAARASREASGLSLDGLGDEIRAVHAELRAVRVSVAELARAQAAAAAGGPSTLARVEEANRRLAEDFSAMSRQITQELSPVLEAGPQQAADLSLVLQGVRAQAGVLQEVRVRVCEEPPGALAGSASSDVAPVLEALRAQAGLLQEVLQSVADLSGFTKQLREGQSSLDLSPVLEAVQALAGSLQQVHQRLSEKSAGASVEPEFREAVKIVKQGVSELVNQLREGKSAVDLSPVLEEVRSLMQLREDKWAVDLSSALEEVRSLKQSREGQPCLEVSPVMEAVQSQAGVLHEVHRWLSERQAGASVEPEFREAVKLVKQGLSEIVNQLREGQSAVDLTPVLEEVRSLKQLREGQSSLDLSPVLEAVQAQAGVLQEVRQRLSEKPAGASVEPEFREAVKIVKQGVSELVNQLREGKSAVDLSPVLEEVRSLKQLRESQPSSDLSPVLEAMQAQASVLQQVYQRLSEKPAGASHEPTTREAVADLSEIVKQLRDSQSSVDMSQVLEEVRLLKQVRENQPTLDLSPVLETMQAQAGVLREIHKRLTEKPSGLSDERMIPEAAADLSEVPEPLADSKESSRRSPIATTVDLSPILAAMRVQADGLQQVQSKVRDLIIIIIAHVANIINTISIINNNMIVNLTNISFIIINTSIGINDPR
ncbi:unnamed protein product [Prorocentrum cordatum]|uniref:Uncharacterized protein n=1 Tax=Prorocentrum cordatum TaxID=2364126 RepID=A0ABN9XVU7_9DINO|nr:unnamed protein product [Polarella glacialis]